MTITLRLRTIDAQSDDRLVLGLDSPRIVLGRGKGCEVVIPDASVSARHASLRQRGSEYIIVDEGSTNGIVVGGVRLPANTPRVVRDGEIVRIGRVWLELRTGMAARSEELAAPGGKAPTAEHVALLWLEHALRHTGVDPSPVVEVTAGPDAGVSFRLSEPGREMVVGRGREANLVLGDANASRRHVGMTWDGAVVRVRDLGSKLGATLGDEPLGGDERAWKPGQTLGVSECQLTLRMPLGESLAKALAAPDARMRSSELAEGPPWLAAEPVATIHAPPEELPPDDADEAGAPLQRETRADRKRGFGPVDLFALLLGLGVLGLSIAALTWLFGR